MDMNTGHAILALRTQSMRVRLLAVGDQRNLVGD